MARCPTISSVSHVVKMPPPPTPVHNPSPALLPVSNSSPRLIVYAQTHHNSSGEPYSLLPLITQNTGVTHIILAALHLNDGPGNITLNDHHPDDSRFANLWGEVRWLQGAGVKVMIMVGGAAKGSWERLSGGQGEVSSAPMFTKEELEWKGRRRRRNSDCSSRQTVNERTSPRPEEQHAVRRLRTPRQALRIWLYKTFVRPRFRRLVLPFYKSFFRALIAQPSQPDVLTPPDQFEAYIKPVIDMIRKYNLSGVDLDIEEEVPLNTPIRTMQRLRQEFGPEFILTLAPTCTALLPYTVPNPNIPLLPYHFSESPVPPGRSPSTLQTLPHLSGFSYPQLLASPQAGHLISWLNAQFYCGWGDASQPTWYDAIIASGWPACKIVFGVVTTERNGSGYVKLGRLREVLRILRARYPDFGGVMGWEYFNAGDGDPSMAGKQAWEWVKALGEVVRSVEIQRPETGVLSAPGSLVQRQPPPASSQGQQGGGHLGIQLPEAQVPWPGEDVQKLVALGFGRAEAIAALNATGGNVEFAAGLLFDQ